ncbi:MAG: peptide ABC transporter permease, partial [Proteobacteria bacterium]|nr:peptide ABC transporter permease [Pseudomonadota bacterium]
MSKGNGEYRGLWAQFTHNLRANRLALVGLVVVLGLLVVALGAPWLTPHDPNAIDVDAILLPPSLSHPFGTDELGRDVFSRMIMGSRVSLEVGLISAGLATLIGVVLGALAGYYGG